MIQRKPEPVRRVSGHTVERRGSGLAPRQRAAATSSATIASARARYGRIGAEVFHSLKSVHKKKGCNTAVGDEGGFAPNLKSNEEAAQVILEAIEKAGYKAGKDVLLGLDAAASEFYENGVYDLKGEGKKKSSEEMVAFYENWVRQYPIITIEDGMSEKDWKGWKLLTDRLGAKVQLVGDDIFVTNTKIFSDGIKQGIGNAILIKLNQIGTLTETLDAIEMAKKARYTAIVSHRSEEVEPQTFEEGRSPGEA